MMLKSISVVCVTKRQVNLAYQAKGTMNTPRGANAIGVFIVIAKN